MAILKPRRVGHGRGAAVVILLAAVGAACEPAPTAVRLTATRVAVHAVLVAGDSSAAVLLSRARPAANAAGPAAWDAVTGATVRLVHAGDTIRLDAGSGACLGDGDAAAASAAGCYTGSVPGGVRAGDVYDLLVNVPGAAPIHGRTRVPRPPTVLAPDGRPVLFFSRGYQPANPPTSVLVRWSAPEPVAHAELRVATDRAGCRTTVTVPDRLHGSLWIQAPAADSAAIAPWYVDCRDNGVGPYPARVVVTVYDERYGRYLALYGRGQSVMLTNAGVGLTGALGVFGAAASGSAPVVLVQR